MTLFAQGALAASADALDAYRWRARPVVIIAPEGDDRGRAQADLLSKAEAALLERNVVVVEVGPETPLGRRFGPGFAVVLVGKDGGEKARWREPVDPQAIAREIDGMPMRQQEMRR